ncbi:hypothetical protein RQ831_18370 [Roseomonas gilardii]|uniref:Uncharacterized protein n=1 Tax=Roseomonas gilardii TaxID=257708 RepID=A0ABU3MJD7_9PROT|nr:hypothetical protein [Roseomonas gilardii]MDT8333022.1 hypothetical protein [Roseomonas gilardii]
MPKPPSTRLPGRKPGPAEREELLRVWDALDPERRKLAIFFMRMLAKDAGLVPLDEPLMITKGVLRGE